jgi:hypothetical protein
MKNVKTIAIIALSILLVFSLSLNIFIFSMFEIKDAESFKQALLCKELLESFNQSATIVDRPNNSNQQDSSNTDTTVPDVQIKEPTKDMIIYNANGVKISFVAQELGMMGPSLKFYVENNTDRVLDICLTDIYIDGFKAEFVGMYCDELAAGKKAYESLIMWESDYEDFSDFPSVIEFVVKIQDSATWNTIDETEPMYLQLD